jgi:hypothetical protein
VVVGGKLAVVVVGAVALREYALLDVEEVLMAAEVALEGMGVAVAVAAVSDDEWGTIGAVDTITVGSD